MERKRIWSIGYKILIGILLGGIALQILFGAGWLCTNLGRVQNTLVSDDIVNAAKELRFDEYSGIVYVLLVALALGVEKVIGLPYDVFLSLFQLALAFGGGCYFWGCIRKDENKVFDKWNVLGSIYFMSIPMMMQMHVTVGLGSVVSSLFLILLGICKRWSEKGSFGELVRICCVWMTMSFLDKAYLTLGAVPIVAVSIFLLKEKKLRMKEIGLIVGAVGVVIGMSAVVIQPAENRIQRTVDGALVSRFVWPWFDQSYYFWPEEIKTVMPQELAYDISLNAENVSRTFGPLVEKNYGREKAGELFRTMAKDSLDVRTISR